jgi:hypothetical protein
MELNKTDKKKQPALWPEYLFHSNIERKAALFAILLVQFHYTDKSKEAAYKPAQLHQF